MSYRDDAIQKLKEALGEKIDPLVVEWICDIIDYKVEAACSDLDDKIHKRGRWDPYY